ncbi:MAG: PAS domain-containing protein [Betaproteobacteria bacterium]|nr:PAS domain-containing protein [Betaproteobacteria bacterium]MDE2622512.1 PAS domain-containing protein [Betaproteobacteria bacterium]
MEPSATSLTQAALQQAILHHIPDPAWLKDSASRYILVNEAFIAAAGLPVEAILGRTPRDVWPGQWGEHFMETDRNVVEKGSRLRFEEERPGPSGDLRWFDTVKTPLFDGQGSVMGIVGISRDITDRKEMEQRLRESRTQLRELSAYLQTVREEERSRISRELHDELGQSLTAIQLGLGSLEERHGDPAVWREALAELQRLTRDTVTSMQRLASDLRPPLLDDLGLPAAIEWLLTTFTQRTRVDHTLHLPETPAGCDADTSTALFRIVQEALTNVSRHSLATHVTVSLQAGADGTRLSVADNGKGMDERLATAPSSLGLIGMRERTLMLGGHLAIRSTPGAGTTVDVHIPANLAQAQPSSSA